MKRFKKALLIGVVLILCVGCDQTSKMVAHDRLAGFPPLCYAWDTFCFQYGANKGAFLGLGAGMPGSVRFWLLVVLVSVALEQKISGLPAEAPQAPEPDGTVVVLNSAQVPGRQPSEILGVVQGHTVFAIWLGKDLSALIRLVLGGELTEYTEMMGRARTTAMNRMIAQAKALGADAIINVRYMTTSVVGTAAELFAYGTAVKLSE